MKVIRHIVTLQSLAALGHKVGSVCSPGRELYIAHLATHREGKGSTQVAVVSLSP